MRIPLSFLAAGLCLALFHDQLGAGPVPTGKPTSYPSWWFERDAIPLLPASATKTNPAWPTDYSPADDFAVANIGQLKAVAHAAWMQMSLRLSPTGAGPAVNQMISAWAQPATVARDDYVTLNAGQLKSVAAHFYNQLNLAYPWASSPTPPDDYAVVNLGQLKYIFSFQIAVSGDTDADGLLDTWEIANFGSLAAQSGVGNAETPTPDALSNRAESLAGTNPTVSADESAAAVTALGLTVYSP